MNTSPWKKDRIICQKRPLQISHIWGSRIRLELEGKTRDLALFNMALDSKLQGCDLVKLKVSDVAYGSSVSSRATVLQQKTGSPVQFEITKGTREAVTALIKIGNLRSKDFLFRSRSELTSTFQPGNTTESFMVGRKAWSRRFALQQTFHEKNKTLPDLQENQESPGDPTSVGS
jgi:hypothetical protein